MKLFLAIWVLLLATNYHISGLNTDKGDILVRVKQDSVASKRSFCCLFAKNHCSQPCEGKPCSAKCQVQCGEDGIFKCPAIPCREGTPKTCTPGPSTITSTTSTEGPGPSTCGDGWQAIGNKCYRHFADLSNFIVANNKCVVRGGTLAVISNKEEQELVASLHPDTGAWIGGMDWLDEGKFAWVDGTWIDSTRSGRSGTGYSNWKDNQPNNGLINQHCVCHRYDGLWDDVTCKREENYVCQKVL